MYQNLAQRDDLIFESYFLKASCVPSAAGDSDQGDLAPVDVELSSELLVAADGRLHLLAAAQLVVGALHLPQAGREGHIGADHHVDPGEGKPGGGGGGGAGFSLSR